MRPGRAQPGASSQSRGAGTVAEDHRDVAARRADVEARRVDLAADHEHAPVASRRDQGIAHLQRVEEATALGAQVDAGDVTRVDRLVKKEGGAREVVLAREGGEQDAVDLARLELGLLECGSRRLACEIRGALALLDPTPLADARALLDPLLRRIHPLSEVGVGDDAVGNAHPRARYSRA
jgi:hypothetical protein